MTTNEDFDEFASKVPDKKPSMFEIKAKEIRDNIDDQGARNKALTKALSNSLAQDIIGVKPMSAPRSLRSLLFRL